MTERISLREIINIMTDYYQSGSDDKEIKLNEIALPNQPHKSGLATGVVISCLPALPFHMDFLYYHPGDKDLVAAMVFMDPPDPAVAPSLERVKWPGSDEECKPDFNALFKINAGPEGVYTEATDEQLLETFQGCHGALKKLLTEGRIMKWVPSESDSGQIWLRVLIRYDVKAGELKKAGSKPITQRNFG